VLIQWAHLPFIPTDGLEMCWTRPCVYMPIRSCAMVHDKRKLLFRPLVCMWALVDSATLQSMQWIINAAYKQHSLQSTPLFTSWFNQQIWGQYMFVPNVCPVGVRCTCFFYCNHNIRGSGLTVNEKLTGVDAWCVDYTLRYTYRSRARKIMLVCNDAWQKVTPFLVVLKFSARCLLQ
jgi:hypothetical protein